MSKTSNRTRVSATAEVYPSTTAYTANDLVGTLLTFADVIDDGYGGGLVESVVIRDTSSEAAAVDLLLFDATVSTTTYATGDNAVLTVADADLDNMVGHVVVAASDYRSFADNAIATVQCSVPFYLSNARNLYGLLVATGTPTYDDTDDLTVTINVMRE